ncbi:MAG: Nif3-like dinuclear metal center hexameric protein, partial [Bacteroidota bacterium]|nr:Nif3-like dinuclear metal center hexameric protein [Bacteroidota bacterium]
MKLQQITDAIEKFAPLALQESYDNAGLIVGNHNMEITGILICVDITESAINEAIDKQCNLIVAHHPIIFKGIKKLNGQSETERCVAKAIKNDIALYAA